MNGICSSSYVGATGVNSLYGMIDRTSNILQYNSSNYTYATSNILQYNSSNYTIATSNILQFDSSNFTRNTSNTIMKEFKQLIYFKEDINEWDNAINTYIINNNALGEIRFTTIGCQSYFGNGEKFVTKITPDGRLFVYYPVNFMYPTVLPGWYAVSDTIRDGYAYQAQTMD